jgi:hypothetical protein
VTRILAQWRYLFALTILVASPWAAYAEQPEPRMTEPEIREVLNAAKRVDRAIPAQALALTRLAWPEEGLPNPQIAAAARAELIDFSHQGLSALRSAIRRVDSRYTADVTATLIDARWRRRSGDPEDFLPGLVDALWYGSVEAKRVAMLELARFRYPPSVLTIADSAHAHPELVGTAVWALGRMGDPRARVFLNETLLDGNPRHRAAAAAALAALGEEGLALLREAVRSDRSEIRGAAVTALLPVSTTEDLTLLHEYVEIYPDDGTGLIPRVRERTIELEAELEEELERQRQLEEEAQQAEDAEGSPAPTD